MVDWDARWRSEAALYGDAPNEGLRMAAARSNVAPGRALCLADGDGRNGAWLAGRGFDVSAVDLSAVATEKARARDARLGVAVDRAQADLAEWSPPPGAQYDLIAILYLHCPQEIRARAFARAFAALAPGGWIFVEGFGLGQAARIGMGPRDPALTYAIEEISAALPAGAVVIEAMEGTALLNEGPGHQGPGEIVRLLARAAG